MTAPTRARVRRFLARVPDPGERRARSGRRVSAAEVDLAMAAIRVAPWWAWKVAARIASLSVRGAVLVLPMGLTTRVDSVAGVARDMAATLGVEVVER